PTSASSAAAARPASPAPTMTASASSAIVSSRQNLFRGDYAWNGAPALLLWREHSAGLGDAAQPVLAERHQRLRGFPGEGSGEQHLTVERLAEAFQPADQIDGGA